MRDRLTDTVLSGQYWLYSDLLFSVLISRDMRFCPNCESLMSPTQSKSNFWTCDRCDFGLKVEGEEQFVSTKSQERDSRKSGNNVKWTVINEHSESPDSCPNCNYQGLALRVKKYIGSRAGTVTRSYYARCRSCNHESLFCREEDPIPGTPDKCPSCGSERLTIELDTEAKLGSREYSGHAECRECESVCYFQTLKE